MFLTSFEHKGNDSYFHMRGAVCLCAVCEKNGTRRAVMKTGDKNVLICSNCDAIHCEKCHGALIDGKHELSGITSIECFPEVLANVEYFEKNAKRCPKCFAYVQKMKGCNQVCCFAKVDGKVCGTVFDYNTMQLDNAREVHCADYKEYVEKEDKEW